MAGIGRAYKAVFTVRLRYFYGPEGKERAAGPLKEVWPEAIFTEGDSYSSNAIYEGAIDDLTACTCSSASNTGDQINFGVLCDNGQLTRINVPGSAFRRFRHSDQRRQYVENGGRGSSGRRAGISR